MKREYDITLFTPMGEKHGVLILFISENHVNGELKILEQITAVDGEIYNGNNIKLTGSLITLVRKIPFTAEGKIGPFNIYLKLVSNSHYYTLNGTERIY